MCIIIDKPAGVSLLPGIIARSIVLNPHGFGIFIDGQIIKTFDVKEGIALLTSKERYTAHLRFATVGDVTLDNIHPFEINPHQALFHNGTVAIPTFKGQTDSAAVADLLSKVPELLWGDILSLSNSRFAVANLDTNKTAIYNKDLWHNKYKCMFSKSNVYEGDFIFVSNPEVLSFLIGIYGLRHLGVAYDVDGNKGHLLLADDKRRVENYERVLGKASTHRLHLADGVSFKAYTHKEVKHELLKKPHYAY